MDKLPTEVTLLISIHLPFETYIQYSQTCRAIQQSLSSTNVISYLNNRFKFGHGNHTGALLLFAFHNILKMPKRIRLMILEHFIEAYQKDDSFIRGWSLIHAIICSNPGRFLELLERDSNHGQKLVGPMPPFGKNKRKLLIQQQRLFAKKIYNSIIVSSVPHKCYLRSSKTYQAIFANLLHSGDLSTTEQCLRMLGPPQYSVILSETDYNERFPITDYSGNIILKRKRNISQQEEYDNPNPVDVICKQDQYLNFTPAQMRLLAKQLLQLYKAKITSYPSSYNGKSAKSKQPHDETTQAKHHHYYQQSHHQRQDFI